MAPLASRSGFETLPLSVYARLWRPSHSLGTPSSLIDFGSTRFALRAAPSASAGEAREAAARTAAQARRGRRGIGVDLGRKVAGFVSIIVAAPTKGVPCGTLAGVCGGKAGLRETQA